MWLAVNENGAEVCSNGLLFRYKDALDRLIEREPKYQMYADRDNIWCNTYTQGHFSVPKFDGVVMPDGSIEKLTGKKMTWQDNPIKI